MSSHEPVRVFVGADRSQQLAVDVLAHSIRRHTRAEVEVIPMVDLPVPTPRDPRNSQRTGFSFSRFCIPKLAGYRGRAIYMDADMQVFKDILGLWSLPFNGAKVLIQEEVRHLDRTLTKENAPAVRRKQCSVMLLDCSRLDWDVEQIVAGLDAGHYTYEQLMADLCLLKEEEIGYDVPFEWNSLEHYDENTCLIHYTDMGTQPWVSCRNSNGERWFDEVREMLRSGALRWEQLEEEVRLGYFRPSLLREIGIGARVPAVLKGLFRRWNEATDRARGYVAHRAVYDAKRLRNQAVREHEARLALAPRAEG